MSGSKLSNPAENCPPVDAPLSMTVYDMPVPGDVAQADERRTRIGRYKMLALMLVCAAPVLASYVTYYFWQPEGRRNFGDLITPPRDMPSVQVHSLDGQPVALQSLRGQWLLVTVGAGTCDATCQNNLYFQRQLREMQGKDKDRIDRVWLIADDGAVPENLRAALAQATVLRMDAAVLGQWLQAAPGHALSDHIYVVDPMGNWMLRFPASMDVQAASKAKRDLERLMRASNSWDQPGR
jgi:hypothetical protein